MPTMGASVALVAKGDGDKPESLLRFVDLDVVMDIADRARQLCHSICMRAFLCGLRGLISGMHRYCVH